MRILFLVLVFIVFGLGQSAAQTNTNDRAYVVQLLHQLKLAEEDSTKIDLHLAIAEAYASDNPDRAVDNARLAKLLAENWNDERRKLRALTLLVRFEYQFNRDLKKGLELIDQAHAIPSQYYTDAISADLLGHEAGIYQQLRADDKAQDRYFQQLLLYEKLGDTLNGSRVYLRLGQLALNRDDLKTARRQYEMAAEGFRQYADQLGLWESLNGLAKISALESRFSQNLALCDEALRISKELDNDPLLAQTQQNLGLARLAVSDTTKAIQAFESAMDISASSDLQEVYVASVLQLGKLYFDQEKDIQAKYYYSEAETKVNQILNRSLKRDVFEAQYRYFEAQGDTAQAYRYLLNLQKIKDELHSDSQSKVLISNQIRYETALKEQENDRLRQREIENQLTIKSQRLQNIGLALFAILVVVLLLFGVRMFIQKKRTNATLETVVKRRTKELEESNTELHTTNEQLETSNTELERFAYIASHDLKSPLRNIISFLNLIERRIKGSPQEAVIKDYLDFATSNAKQMHALIQDVLEYSKANQKDVELDEKVDLNEVVQLAINNLTEQLNSQKATLLIEPLPVITGNKIQLIQVFQNLIGNGIKYNESKKPTVYVGARVAENQQLTFFVKDNGIGVPQQYADQIFEMFKRLHTQDKFSGTGIGLALVKKIISALGGQVWLHSETGKGSTFFFVFEDSRVSPTFQPQPKAVQKKHFSGSPTDSLVN